MTITDLSALTGLAAVSISNLEKNRRTASFPTLRELSIALDVPASFIGCFEKLPEASIAEKIKKARYYHCLTREEMANRIGVNPRTIFDWESGLRKPLKKNLVAIEKFLEILL